MPEVWIAWTVFDKTRRLSQILNSLSHTWGIIVFGRTMFCASQDHILVEEVFYAVSQRGSRLAGIPTKRRGQVDRRTGRHGRGGCGRHV